MRNRYHRTLNHIIVSVLCIVMLLSFAGCQKDTESSKKSYSKTEATSETEEGGNGDHVYNIEEADYNTYIEYEDLLLSIEADYLNSSGYVESQDIPKVLDEAEATAQQGISEGVIEYYNREDDNIFIKFASGIPYLFVPYKEGVLAGSGGGRILTLEPNENDYNVNFSYVVSNLATMIGEIEHEGSLRPYSNANLIVKTFPDLYTYDYRLKPPIEVNDPLIGNGDSLRNGNVTIESMKALSDYKVIMFEGHGGYNDEIHSALITGESFVGWKEFSKYKEDLENNVIVLTSFPTIAETGIPYSPIRYYGITSKFVEKYIGDMDGAIVFLGACSSLKDNVLAQSFLDKGASVVLGYTEITTMYYEMISRTVLFNELVKETSYGYQTVSDAYQKTMDIVGVDEYECILSYVSSDNLARRYTLNGLLEEPSDDAVQSVDLVTEAYSNDCTYTAEIYNNETGAFEETEITNIYRIPKINLSGDRIEQINTEIYDTYYPVIEDSVEEINQEGYPFTSEEVSYRWAVNGNILSLVILNRSLPDFGGNDEYVVYNIDISSGKEIATSAVLQTAGLTEATYYEKAKQVLGSAFWSVWDQNNENFKQQGFVEFFNEQFRKTTSDGNIAESYPYINEKGEICLIAKVYALAGATYYWNDLNMIDFELSPNYATEAQCLTSKPQVPNQVDPNSSAHAIGSPEWAVGIYMANKDVWMHNPEYTPMRGRSYCLLDLDFDGVLELIDSENDGSGRYSYNHFYKINIEKQTVEEFFSETDQDGSGIDYHYMADKLKLFKKPSGSMFYLGEDYIHVSAGEGVISYCECYMQNGIFYENALFSEYWHPDYENGSDDTTTDYKFKGQKNSQSEYKKNTEAFYQENKDCNLAWSKLPVDEFVESDTATQQKRMLEAYRSFSYDGFSFKSAVIDDTPSSSTKEPLKEENAKKYSMVDYHGMTIDDVAELWGSDYTVMDELIAGGWGGIYYKDGRCPLLFCFESVDIPSNCSGDEVLAGVITYPEIQDSDFYAIDDISLVCLRSDVSRKIDGEFYEDQLNEEYSYHCQLENGIVLVFIWDEHGQIPCEISVSFDQKQEISSNHNENSNMPNYRDQSVEQLRKNIIGNWGLAAYYTFEADGTCYFLGDKSNSGTYKITEKKTLIIKFPWTSDEYTWSELSFDEFHQKYGYDKYFWYLTPEGVLRLNGSEYHRDGQIALN